MGRYWLRVRRLVLHNVLHADDSPHDIALGVAIAIVVAFLPLVGFQTAIAVGLAALCGANKAVAIPIVWITNPITILPVYGGCFALGRVVLQSAQHGTISDHMTQLIEGVQEFQFFELGTWKELFDALAGLGMELWVGCLIVGLVFGVLSYFISRSAVVRYRERRRRRILRRILLRPNNREAAAPGPDPTA